MAFQSHYRLDLGNLLNLFYHYILTYQLLEVHFYKMVSLKFLEQELTLIAAGLVKAFGLIYSSFSYSIHVLLYWPVVLSGRLSVVALQAALHISFNKTLNNLPCFTDY